jgi:hypothetical protein
MMSLARRRALMLRRAFGRFGAAVRSIRRYSARRDRRRLAGGCFAHAGAVSHCCLAPASYLSIGRSSSCCRIGERPLTLPFAAVRAKADEVLAVDLDRLYVYVDRYRHCLLIHCWHAVRREYSTEACRTGWAPFQSLVKGLFVRGIEPEGAGYSISTQAPLTNR